MYTYITVIQVETERFAHFFCHWNGKHVEEISEFLN